MQIKEIAEARPPASDPALPGNKHRMCDGMSSVSAAVQIENSGAGGRLGHHQKWRRVEGFQPEQASQEPSAQRQANALTTT
jgi:hypothetical protein